MRAHGKKAAGRIDDRIADQRRFARARRRKNKGAAVAVGLQGHRERAANRAQIAGQRELAGKFVACKRIGGNLAGRGENTQGDGQIESRRVLGQVRRREIDRDLSRGEFELRILNRRAHPVAAFLDFGFRKPDEIERGQAASQIHFDFDRQCVEPRKRSAVHHRQRHAPSAQASRQAAEIALRARAKLFARRRTVASRLERGDASFERVELFSSPQQKLSLNFELLARNQIELGRRTGDHRAKVFLDVPSRACCDGFIDPRADVVEKFAVEHGLSPGLDPANPV